MSHRVRIQVLAKGFFVIAVVGFLGVLILRNTQSESPTRASPWKTSKPIVGQVSDKASFPESLRPGANSPIVSDSVLMSNLDDLLGSLERASDLESPEEVIDAIIAVGRLMTAQETHAATRVRLEERLMREKNTRVSVLLALLLSAYDVPAPKIVKSLLSSASLRTGSEYGLLISLTIGRIPSSWGEGGERQLWRELILSVPEAMPKYCEYFLSTLSSETKLYTHATLSRIARAKISDSSLIQPFFDYLARTQDAQLATKMDGWIQFTDGNALPQLIAATQVAVSPEMKQAFSLYISSLIVVDPNQLATWYAGESNESLRRELGCTIIGMKSENPLTWFDAIYSIETSGKVKNALLIKLSGIESPIAVQRLLEISVSGEVSQRIQALRSLSGTYRHLAVGLKEDGFLRATQDSRPEIRIAGLECLYSVTLAKHRATFQRLSSVDEDETVRQTASRLLRNLEE